MTFFIAVSAQPPFSSSLEQVRRSEIKKQRSKTRAVEEFCKPKCRKDEINELVRHCEGIDKGKIKDKAVFARILGKLY